MSLLHKFISGTKYGSHIQYGRSGNYKTEFIHEPVGFVFYTEANIETILHSIRIVHPTVEYADIHDIMFNLFHYKAASTVEYINHENTSLIQVKVNALNKSVIEEINKQFGGNMHIHEQYQFVLAHPNRIAPNPGPVFQQTKEMGNPYYGQDQPISDLPNPYAFPLVQQGLSKSGLGNVNLFDETHTREMVQDHTPDNTPIINPYGFALYNGIGKSGVGDAPLYDETHKSSDFNLRKRTGQITNPYGFSLIPFFGKSGLSNEPVRDLTQKKS
jgi:hypothetical protein